MRDTKHGHDYIAEMLGVLSARDTRGDRLGATSKCRKVEGFTDRHVGKVGVDLCGVNRLASEMACHLARPNSLVVDDGFVIDMEAVSIPSDRSEKSRAAGARGPKNSQHLAAMNHAFESAKDIDSLLLLSQKDFSEVSGALEDDVSHRLLIVGRGAEPVHAEVSKGNASSYGLDAVSVAVTEMEEGLRPLPRVELGAFGIKKGMGWGREQAWLGMLGIGRVSTSQLSEFLVHPRIFVDAMRSTVLDTLRGLVSHDGSIRADRIRGIRPWLLVLGHVFGC